VKGGVSISLGDGLGEGPSLSAGEGVPPGGAEDATLDGVGEKVGSVGDCAGVDALDDAGVTAGVTNCSPVVATTGDFGLLAGGCCGTGEGVGVGGVGPSANSDGVETHDASNASKLCNEELTLVSLLSEGAGEGVLLGVGVNTASTNSA